MNQRLDAIAARFKWLPKYAAPAGRVLELLLTLALLVGAMATLAHYVGIGLQRMVYPFDLEWCEGGMLAHIRMVLSGHQPYHAPSVDFTSYGYPPLYWYVSAIPSLFLGAGHLAPRLVSFLSILGCFVILGRWVRDETDDPVAGVVAIALLSATYQLTGYWFELARVDSFFLLMVLSGVTIAKDAKTDRAAVLAGVFMAAACFTKQTGIPLAVPTLLVLTLRSIRFGLIGAIVSGGLMLIAGIALNVASQGWFLFYTMQLLARHEVEWYRLQSSIESFFLGATLPMTFCGLALLCSVGFGRGSWKRWLFHAVFLGVAFIASFMPFLKSGGYPNGLIPAYAALALASGFVIAALRRSTGSVLGTLGTRAVASMVVLIQFLLLNYDATPSIPTAADLEANQTVMERLAKLPKPLYVTGSSFYMMTPDHTPPPSDTMGIIDVYKGGGDQVKALDADLRNAIRTHRFKTIVMDRAAGFLPSDIVALIRQEYVPHGSVLHGLPPNVMWNRSGALLRPDMIWIAPPGR